MDTEGVAHNFFSELSDSWLNTNFNWCNLLIIKLLES